MDYCVRRRSTPFGRKVKGGERGREITLTFATQRTNRTDGNIDLSLKGQTSGPHREVSWHDNWLLYSCRCSVPLSCIDGPLPLPCNVSSGSGQCFTEADLLQTLMGRSQLTGLMFTPLDSFPKNQICSSSSDIDSRGGKSGVYISNCQATGWYRVFF